jgi:hypothetical protein
MTEENTSVNSEYSKGSDTVSGTAVDRGSIEEEEEEEEEEELEGESDSSSGMEAETRAELGDEDMEATPEGIAEGMGAATTD